jgi:alkaline phosphatase
MLSRILVGLFVVCSAAPAFAGSAIFLHPDGMGAEVWSALRLKEVGPDGRLAWDQLPNVAVYVGPMSDSVNASSNGGATSHAYGIRARLDSFGSVTPDGKRPLALSGERLSLMHEAQAAGKRVGIVNSSSVTEPGTGAFLASVDAREDEDDIAAQILKATISLSSKTSSNICATATLFRKTIATPAIARRSILKIANPR